MVEKKIIDISWSSLLKIILCFFVCYLLFLIKEILIWAIFSLLISILVTPLINYLEGKKIPRTISTFFIFSILLLVLGLLIYSTASAFIFEIQQFSRSLPEYFQAISPTFQRLGFEFLKDFKTFSLEIQKWLVQLSGNIFSALTTFFGGILATFTIFALAFFLTVEKESVEKAIKIFAPREQEDEILALWRETQEKIAGWFGTRILSCLLVGGLSYICLIILNIKYPFLLALFAGISNFIPVLGPFLAGSVMGGIAIFDSLLKAVLIVILFFLIQQIENLVFTPLLCQKFIGLPSSLVLISLLIGAKLWGILGAILAIPLGGVLFEFTVDYFKRKKRNS